jgi:hypothetical protein
MRTAWTAALIAAVILALVGCATHEEWQTWQEHPTHFASLDHMSFSIQNRSTSNARITREDLGRASDEAWWGKQVTVAQEQILER